MLSASFHQRLHDLADHVTQDLKLLKQYEDKLRLTDDPKQEARYRQEVDQLRISAQKYQQESDELREQLANKLSMERQNFEKERQTTENQLNQIAADVKALMSGQAIILGELNQTGQPPAHKPIWQVAREIRQRLTDEDRRWSPQDGAVNHDYYIYGTPKPNHENVVRRCVLLDCLDQSR